MMADRFNDRRLSTVYISDLHVVRTREDETAVATVGIALTTADGEPDGPSVSVEIASQVDSSMPFREIELAVLSSAIDLLKRISQETPHSLHDAWTEWTLRIAEKAGTTSG